MMDRTYRHYRYMMRLITRHTFLYTEMIPADAICYGKRDKILSFNSIEHPISIQLGGSKLEHLKEASKIAEQFGYDEINLNVGCPSDRVQEGKFGACLMLEPNLVAELIYEMQKVVKIPITIKHRIGVDNQDSYEVLHKFVSKIASIGCQRFSIHARKAFLKGLSPKENRTIPPLKYDFVHQIKKDFPNLIIEINGGIKTLIEAKEQLQYTDGVMIGRAAWDNPFLFSEADMFFEEKKVCNPPNREIVIEQYSEYIKEQLSNGEHMSLLLLPIFNIFTGVAGAAYWRRYLSENGNKKDTSPLILTTALKKLYENKMEKSYESTNPF